MKDQLSRTKHYRMVLPTVDDTVYLDMQGTTYLDHLLRLFIKNLITE